MIFTAIILGIAILFLITELLKFIKRKDWGSIILLSIINLLCITFEVLLIYTALNAKPEPTALDVYRGLTELKISYINGVPQDTIVVLKNR